MATPVEPLPREPKGWAQQGAGRPFQKQKVLEHHLRDPDAINCPWQAEEKRGREATAQSKRQRWEERQGRTGGRRDTQTETNRRRERERGRGRGEETKWETDGEHGHNGKHQKRRAEAALPFWCQGPPYPWLRVRRTPTTQSAGIRTPHAHPCLPESVSVHPDRSCQCVCSEAPVSRWAAAHCHSALFDRLSPKGSGGFWGAGVGGVRPQRP